MKVSMFEISELTESLCILSDLCRSECHSSFFPPVKYSVYTFIDNMSFLNHVLE